MKRPNQQRRPPERPEGGGLVGTLSASQVSALSQRSAPLAVWRPLGARSSSVDNFFPVLHNSKKTAGIRFQGTRHSKKEGEQNGR
jgi:hypothetical protein